MTDLSKTALLTILQTALAEPIGLVLRTSDPTRARATLYRIRSEANDPTLSVLQIRASPFPAEGDLIICHVRAPRSRASAAHPSLDDLLDED